MSDPFLISKVFKFKDSEREPVYEQGKDVVSTLHNIANDIREDANQAMINDWSISPKALKSCNLKVHGTNDVMKVEFRVSEFQGGYRVPAENPHILAARADETYKLLKKFEDLVKKEFKSRAGKTLTLKNKKENVDWKLVALNGLYQFTAVKVYDCPVDLKQEFSEE